MVKKCGVTVCGETKHTIVGLRGFKKKLVVRFCFFKISVSGVQSAARGPVVALAVIQSGSDRQFFLAYLGQDEII